MRAKDLPIDLDTMTINVPLVSEKVMVIVIDGHQGKAKITEAVEHGHTVIETAKGKAFRIHYDEKELF
jgi:hypothetical protein